MDAFILYALKLALSNRFEWSLWILLIFFQWFPPLGSQLRMIPSSVLLIKWSRKILRFPRPQAINNNWSLKPFPFLVVLYGCQVFHFSLPLYLRTERCSEDNFGLRSALISLNFSRLLRVVITPFVERRKRLEAIGWISGYALLDVLSRLGVAALQQRRTKLCNKLLTKL